MPIKSASVSKDCKLGAERYYKEHLEIPNFYDVTDKK